MFSYIVHLLWFMQWSDYPFVGKNLLDKLLKPKPIQKIVDYEPTVYLYDLSLIMKRLLSKKKT